MRFHVAILATHMHGTAQTLLAFRFPLASTEETPLVVLLLQFCV